MSDSLLCVMECMYAYVYGIHKFTVVATKAGLSKHGGTNNNPLI